MIRRNLKKISKSEKLKKFILKYRVPGEYLSTNRRMVSKAVFIGLFIAFIPMPMQMALVLAIMPFTKFNVPIALAMCWISNPFTMAPMYYMEYTTGSFFLGKETLDVEISIKWFSDHFDDIFISLYAGTLFFSVTFSSLGYWLVNYFWKSSVHRDKKLHRRHRKK